MNKISLLFIFLFLFSCTKIEEVTITDEKTQTGDLKEVENELNNILDLINEE